MGFSEPVLLFEGVSKKFYRTFSSALGYRAYDFARHLIRIPSEGKLRHSEFWALRDVSFSLHAGECVGIIGPNGAGKSTLLKLVHRDYSPDRGRILTTKERIRSLIRLGEGLSPLLTGRENLYLKCAEAGIHVSKASILLEEVIAFVEMENVLDTPIKHYSDGLYARLAFALATFFPLDILLIDEVLSVTDMAFQSRAIQRLTQLKESGAAILFVSHSEPHVRCIADRCLLLLEGKTVGLGDSDTLFLRYYELAGLAQHSLKQRKGHLPDLPKNVSGGVSIEGITPLEQKHGPYTAITARPLILIIRYSGSGNGLPVANSTLVVHFWHPIHGLAGSFESQVDVDTVVTQDVQMQVEFPSFELMAGTYHVGVGIESNGQWLGYRSDLLALTVSQEERTYPQGLCVLFGKVTFFR